MTIILNYPILGPTPLFQLFHHSPIFNQLFFNLAGRVCIPIDPAKADTFDPEAVPTITQLTSEIDRFAQEEKEKTVSKDYKKTSLREPVKIFEEFLSKLAETWKGKLIESSDTQMNF